MSDLPSLLVGCASGREPKWNFLKSLVDMMGMTNSVSRIMFQPMLYFATDDARCKLVDHARMVGATHILMVDDDNSFPFNTADRLLAHKKPIVAANYTSRGHPVTPLSMKDGKRVHSRGRSGLEVVDFAPTGVMLIDMAVFDHIEMPWFYSEYVPGEGKMSDDVYFCRKAKRAGFDTWIDHDLSQECGHAGLTIYNHSMIREPEPTDALMLAKEMLA